MTDYFALLEQPRRPCCDLDALKSRFLALAGEVHPDRNASQGTSATQTRSAELNAAYTCLKEPRDRIRHLLELENGRRPTDLQSIPEELASFFLRVGVLGCEADSRNRRRQAADSLILRTEMFTADQSVTDEMLTVEQELLARRDELLLQVKALDSRWLAEGENRADQLRALEQMYRSLSFLTRWLGQVQERVLQLSLP